MKNFLIQILLGCLFSTIYLSTLYYYGFLEDYCFDLDDCRIILIYSLIKLLILFAIFNIIWLSKIENFKISLILLSNIFLFSFFFFGNDSFINTPLILSVVLFNIFVVNFYTKEIKYLMIENFLIFILLNMMYLSCEEFFLGSPFSMQEIESSGNLFGKFIVYSGSMMFLLTTIVAYLRVKKTPKIS
ncbi:hypothetical protein ASG22_09245 [Chryseobacterium sp. Leaf405]|uniref:hypothetical protein n=1 Tax=Chryseobacterium sp. Leaf405 TaxID=1736367 RepID=UPI0006F66C25|nr:hypothetical protein [Chryseobacterium sp. Leaf405]KQT24190.1 hypothetical protein ASG22_09245 [Chryseobacterium sp. Leaf405]